MHDTGLRSALRGLGAIVIFAVVTLAPFNLLVASNALESLINGAQKDVTLSFDADFIWWPTHIEGDDFELMVHDPAIQAQLNIDEYAVDWNPLALFEKKFHATKVRARGIRFELRKTRLLPELCAQSPGLPVIPGQSLPPGVVEGECLEQVDTARAAGPEPERDQVVKVQLDDVKAEGLNELWFERYRARGYAAFDGGWSFHPTFETRVDVSDFSSQPWTVHVDGRPVANRVRFDGVGHVDSLQLRELSGWQSRVSLRGDIEGRGVDVSHLARAMGHSGEGSLDVWVDLNVDSGAPAYLATRVRGSAITLEGGEFTVHGTPDVALTFASSDDTAHIRTGTATITGLRLGGDHKEATSVVVRTSTDSFVRRTPLFASVGLTAHTSNLEPIMAALEGLPRTILDLLIAQSTNIRARGRLKAGRGKARLEPIRVEAGALSVDGHIQLVPKLDGELEAQLGPVTVKKKLGPKSGSSPDSSSSSKR
jgi:hypothetical protein